MATTTTRPRAGKKPGSKPPAKPAPAPAALPPIAVMLPYQERFAADESKLKLWIKARRIGADYAMAWHAVMDRISGRNTRDLNYQSSTEAESMDFLDYCADFLRAILGAVRIVIDVENIDGVEIRNKVIEIPSPSGKIVRIRALSSNPRAWRGKDGDAVLSEFAFFEHPDEALRAAIPTTAHGGTVSIVTTVNVEDDAAEQLRKMGQRRLDGEPLPGDVDVSLHVTTIDDAIAEGLVEQINATRGTTHTRESYLAELQKVMTPEAFECEFRCVPRASVGSYFPRHLLTPCIAKPGHPLVVGYRWIERPRGAAQEPHADKLWSERAAAEIEKLIADIDKRVDSGRLYIGEDIARTTDYYVLTFVLEQGDHITTLGGLRWRGMRFGDMEMVGDRAMSHRFRAGRVRRGCGDATAIGMQIAEHRERTHRGRYEGVHATTKVNADLMTTLRATIEGGNFVLANDRGLLRALDRIVETRTSNGAARYSTAAGNEGHADEAWSLALAVHAATERRSEARWVQTVGGVAP